MAIFVPFNFNPETTVQTTGNYTVPAGYYALASCQASGGSDVAINGTTVLNSDSGSRHDSFEVTNAGYTVPAGFHGVVTVQIPTGESVTIDGTVFGPNSAGYGFNVNVGPGAQITPTASDICQVAIYPVQNKTENSNTYWLKAGDSITGGRKHISVYRVQSTT